MTRFPDGYTNDTLPPNLKEDEHFQNWMRTAGLPTFTKLWGRNDNDNLLAGRYQIVIDLSAYTLHCSTAHINLNLTTETLQTTLSSPTTVRSPLSFPLCPG